VIGVTDTFAPQHILLPMALGWVAIMWKEPAGPLSGSSRARLQRARRFADEQVLLQLLRFAMPCQRAVAVEVLRRKLRLLARHVDPDNL